MSERNQFEQLRVVLVRTRNPLNIGAVARAMSNFGCSCLRVVQPYEASFREARSAVGASEILARAEQYDSVAEAVGDCTLVVGTTSMGKRELPQPVEWLETGAALIRRQLALGRVAVLFGSEKTGLRNEDLSHCHWLMRIPTREEHHSMNLGQAIAVCLYELVRHNGADKASSERKHQGESALRRSVRPLSSPRKSDGKTAPPRRALARTGSEQATLQGNLVPAVVLERLTAMLLELLHRSGYLKRQSAGSDEKVRRLVRRLNLDAQDAETILGMLRQILWKMDHQ